MMFTQDIAVAVFYLMAKKLEDIYGPCDMGLIKPSDSIVCVVDKANSIMGSIYDGNHYRIQVGDDALVSIEKMDRAIEVARDGGSK